MAGEKKISFQPPLIFFKNTWHIWSSLGGGGGECLTAGRCGMVIFIFKMSFLNSFIALIIFHYVIYLNLKWEYTLLHTYVYKFRQPSLKSFFNLHMFWMIVWLQQCSNYCYVLLNSLYVDVHFFPNSAPWVSMTYELNYE